MPFVLSDMPDDLASRRPLLYSGLLTFAFIAAIVVVALAGSATHSQEGIEISGALGRGIVAGLALVALATTPDARWLAAPSGLGWAAAAVVLAYILVVFPPLFSGRYAVPIGRFPAYVALDGFAAGVAEEAVFRGGSATNSRSTRLGLLAGAGVCRPRARRRFTLGRRTGARTIQRLCPREPAERLRRNLHASGAAARRRAVATRRQRSVAAT
jgi:hypothetical protein